MRAVMRAMVSLLVAVVLVGILVELSCVAGERSLAPPSAAPAALVITAPTVDPPTLSEADADEVSEIPVRPALTR